MNNPLLQKALIALASTRAALKNGVLHYNKAGELLETDIEILQCMRDEKAVRTDARFMRILTTEEEELDFIRSSLEKP